MVVAQQGVQFKVERDVGRPLLNHELNQGCAQQRNERRVRRMSVTKIIHNTKRHQYSQINKTIRVENYNRSGMRSTVSLALHSLGSQPERTAPLANQTWLNYGRLQAHYYRSGQGHGQTDLWVARTAARRALLQKCFFLMTFFRSSDSGRFETTPHRP